MEELIELKAHIEQQDYDKALLLIDEMEEMAKDDKLHKIRSYAIVLLLHLIKRQAEQRTTKSWEISIQNAIEEIKYTNQRRKAKGQYINEDELKEVLENAFDSALRRASNEAFEGVFTDKELAQKIEKQAVLSEAISFLI